MTIDVRIIEGGLKTGHQVDAVTGFPTVEQVQEFVEKYNAVNDTHKQTHAELAAEEKC